MLIPTLLVFQVCSKDKMNKRERTLSTVKYCAMSITDGQSLDGLFFFKPLILLCVCVSFFVCVCVIFLLILIFGCIRSLLMHAGFLSLRRAGGYSVMVRGLLIAVASLVAEHRL